ncbi:hypothetical protein [Flavilitoribacter nigricans]|uniref:Uncharacterized protein n=1 Tax=Flavilitoribacter nigricans (strain ATCC 23147 / DSM 23189 / NBRC 102662 / NCIMB 1420 / SS-2) TaxID=1122177 RepID=A0A2D0MYP0_FLAN2|nr:hypothetical protein [Flavilitoribacter nigricans]PHN01365.1 hypothetical protein CRP01_37505 [Flavilitoribacter nigricans DSM 23189 = NBRC 102662]
MNLLFLNFLLASTLLLFNTPTADPGMSANLKDFKIVIEKNDGEIKMKCTEGCAWLDLSYENKTVAQAIDQYGMTEIRKEPAVADEELSDFLFTLTKTETGVSLKGIRGTAWLELSFTLKPGEQQLIDQYGMRD